MGNTPEPSQKSQLAFIQVLSDRHFKDVEIHRSSQGLFIMKMSRSMAQSKEHEQFIYLIETLREHKIGNIIPIVHYSSTEHVGICGTFEQVDIYTEYYNFTLADLFATNKHTEAAELWLVIHSFLRLIVTLKQYHVTIDLQIDKIFLTPTGIPCVYPYCLKSCKNVISFTMLSMGQQLVAVILQLAFNMKEKEWTEEQLVKQVHLLATRNGQYKAMATILLGLIDSDREYADIFNQVEELQERGLAKVAQCLKLLKFKYCLPNNLQYLNPPPQKQNKQSTNKPEKRQNPRPQRMKTQYSSASSQANKCVNKIKEESNRVLVELDRKKEQYRLHKQQFQLRKEELLKMAKGKEGLRMPGKHLKKGDSESNSRKQTQNSVHQRFR